MHAPEQLLLGKRIIYYTDTHSFGGHEVASFRILQWLLGQGASVHLFFPASNSRLNKQVSTLAQRHELHIHNISRPKIRFHRLYHVFCPKFLKELSQRFANLKPDIVFVSQGNLEISASGALAAKLAKIPSISYIPMAHSFIEMKSNKAWRRELFNAYLAKVPDRWLTCSNAQAKRLRNRGARQPIHILPNPYEEQTPTTQESARQTLGLSPDITILGMAGRLNNKQKGCDIFSKALLTAASDSPLRQTHLLFIGDGEDADKNISSLQNGGWEGKIHRFDWQDDITKYYPAFNLLVMPSRFEGLPLTMQEALLCGVPMATSDVDGLGEFLPQEWTTKTESPESLRQLLERYLHAPERYRKPLTQLQLRVRSDHNQVTMGEILHQNFAALLG